MKKVNKETAPSPRMKTIVKAQVREEKILIDPLWVRSHTVSMLTKWDFRMLEKLRDEGNIIFEKRGNNTWYELDSIYRVWSKMIKFQTA